MSLFFFFQAEDGIRDLVRSRGLGDVYKRQGSGGNPAFSQYDLDSSLRPVFYAAVLGWMGIGAWLLNLRSVSYTHLTLPTSDLV